MTGPYDWGKARKVDGGIRARSTRGAIGESWWSKRFLAVLESFALGTRLTRGRAYARAGQVLTLSIEPGTVTATVQGSRPSPYRVRVTLAKFTDEVWSGVEHALAAEALGTAKLLAGELPAYIEDVFASSGAPLFPKRLADLAMTCNCPDGAVPCKHLAATFYLLAERFDGDPFQILLWRGRSREVLLGRLRELRSGGSGPSEVLVEAPTGTGRVLGELVEPDVEDERFWLPPVPLVDKEPALVTQRDLLLRQLPTPAAELGGAELLAALRAFYRR